MVGSDVLERRDQADAIAQNRLRSQRGGALLRKLHPCDARRHQRHGDVDDDLSGGGLGHLGQCRPLRGVGDGDHDDVRGRCRIGVGSALEAAREPITTR